LAVKTGTDNQSTTENILPKSCFSGIETNGNIKQCTQTGLDNELKTQLRLNTEAELNSIDPKVRDSKPFRRNCLNDEHFS
jgi:hypothetical protein